jgi:hypothetical protein
MGGVIAYRRVVQNATVVRAAVSCPGVRRLKVRSPFQRRAAPSPPQVPIDYDQDQWQGVIFSPIYRVILHYSGWSEDREVATRAKRALPDMSWDQCFRAVEQARAYGVSIMMTAPHTEAMAACQRLANVGLKATTEEA